MCLSITLHFLAHHGLDGAELCSVVDCLETCLPRLGKHSENPVGETRGAGPPALSCMAQMELPLPPKGMSDKCKNRCISPACFAVVILTSMANGTEFFFHHGEDHAADWIAIRTSPIKLVPARYQRRG